MTLWNARTRRSIASLAKYRKLALTQCQIMVVSQWTSCLNLVSDYLKQEGLLHVKSVPA
jgi:hypothetical protein